MFQFLEWAAASVRTHDEVMQAWRTSCPRLSIWEDALAEGFIEIGAVATGDESRVLVTGKGREFLANRAGDRS
jgi:hypothetical protein